MRLTRTSDACTTDSGTNETRDKEAVLNMQAAGMMPAQLAVGVGSMLDPPSSSGGFNWTQPKLNDFLTWSAAQGVLEVDVWRAGIDDYGKTQQWFLDELAAFLAPSE